jgi:S1-C subfamily serine protease
MVYPLGMARFMIAMLFLAGACAAEQGMPDIPDPYGLGERLALIDYLNEHFSVKAPEGASLEDLIALYWRYQQAAAAPTEDEILARDRMQRMRAQLAELRVDAPEQATEAELATLLGSAKSAASSEAVEKVLSRAAAKENPESPEQAAEFARVDSDNLQATIDRLASDIRAERVTVASLEKKGGQHLTDLDAANKKLAELNAASAAAAKTYANAVTAYNDTMTSKSSTAESKKAVDQASQAQKQCTAACDAQKAAIKQLEQQLVDIERQLETVHKRIALLGKQRAELASNLVNMKPPTESAPKIATPVASQGAPAPPPGSLEERLKSAVVLLWVEGRGCGTGFFISSDGLLITNAHVIGEEPAPVIALWDGSTKHEKVSLQMVKILPEHDLALLRAESGQNFQALEMLEVYDLSHPILAVGFPMAGQMANSLGTSPSDIVVSRGILGSVRRKDGSPQWLQHDCKIASGSSGGPIVDQNSGAVIGINTMVMNPNDSGAAGDSMSLAIPVKKVRDLFGALIP